MKIKFYVDKHPLYYGKVYWFLALVKSSRQIDFELVDAVEDGDFSIGSGRDFPISIPFYDKLSIELFDHSVFFTDRLMITTADGKDDIISTVFYLVNCIQEYKPNKKDLDEYGRFKKEATVQYKFGLSETNYVQELIDTFLIKCGVKRLQKQPSKVYISHDIDFLTSGFRQEVTWALKERKISNVIGFCKQFLSGKSPWYNTKEIAKMDSDLDVPSTFYWLNYKQSSKEGIQNADYDLNELDMEEVSKFGLTNGLHKSATENTMRKEVGDFPDVVSHNRYHFLKFSLPDSWKDLDKAKIKTDGSLGFSKGINLRNSYGRPFYPYNIYTERPYKTLVLPLQIMDVGLAAYKSKNRHQIVKEVMTFIEDNREDSLISMLWHNNELTEYSNAHMLEAYKDIIDILKESKIDIIGIDDVVNEYG